MDNTFVKDLTTLFGKINIENSLIIYYLLINK